MSRTYRTRMTGWTVVPEGEPLFSEMGWSLEIVDEGPGEFVMVKSLGQGASSEIAIEPQEWPALRKAIDAAIAECEEDKLEAKIQVHSGDLLPDDLP